MKKFIIYGIAVFFISFSCSKDETNTNENNIINSIDTISTWFYTFQPSIINCNLGDTVYFELGGSHNAIEVSEDTYNANLSTPIMNGFEFGYGESGFFIPIESKTYFYVCTPHLPEMKGKIIVH